MRLRHIQNAIRDAYRNAKIRTKILCIVVAVCLFSLISVTSAGLYTINRISSYTTDINIKLGGASMRHAQDALIDQAHQYLNILTNEQAEKFNTLLSSIMYDVQLMAGVTEDILQNPEHYGGGRTVVRPSEAVEGVFTSTYSLPESVAMTAEIENELRLLSNLVLLTPTMVNNPDIIELYIGMESGLFYNYTPVTFENPEYDPRTRPWYEKAKENPDDVIFTDVYEDAFGTGLVLTAAKAIHAENGELLGVAALDILLQNLKDLVLGMRIMESGYAFIINEKGDFIVHPDMGADGFASNVADIAGSSEDLAEGYRQMMAGQSGFVTYQSDGNTMYLKFSPISVSGWSIGIHADEDEVLRMLKALSAEMEELTSEAQKNTADMTGSALIIFIVVILLVVVMVAFMSAALTRLISKPIGNLTCEVGKVGDGNFEYRIPPMPDDEIGFLSRAFNDMADRLYSHAQNIIALEQKKAEIQGLFGRFVSPDVVQEMVAGDTDILLGGIEKEVTVLFADIRGFTAFSEANPAHKVVSIVNRYLELMSKSIQAGGGMIDKFIGDAAMAVFNAPNDLPDHALCAVKAAWKMKQDSVSLCEEILRDYGVDLQFGIGINTGKAVIGNMGCDFRMDYTAIGDTVNTAARLEANASSGQILLSASTYQLVRQHVEVSDLGVLKVKNKKIGIHIYNLEHCKV